MPYEILSWIAGQLILTDETATLESAQLAIDRLAVAGYNATYRAKPNKEKENVWAKKFAKSPMDSLPNVGTPIPANS